MIRSLLCCGLLIAGVAVAHDTPDAHATFARLLTQLKAAHQRGNTREAVSRSLELAAFLHDSGPAAEQVAMAYSEDGDRSESLTWLEAFVAMGQSDDGLAQRPQFANFKTSPEFERILVGMRQNDSTIDLATTVTHFSDAGLLPEDMDFNPTTRSFLVTSVLKHKIVSIGPDGTQRDFAQSPDGWPMLAIKIDARRGIVWATEVALDHFAAAPSKDWGRSAVLCFRLQNHALVGKIPAPNTALGDMMLAPNGNVIISDGDNGGVYRATAGCHDTALQRVDSGQFVSPQTPALGPDLRHIFVPDYARGVGMLDLETKQVQWIDTHKRYSMHGIDGMYSIPGGLLSIQNGASPQRVIQFRVDGHLNVSGERIIEQSGTDPGDQTHGVLVGRVFYYIANAGWRALNGSGHLKRGIKMTPATIKKIAIGTL